MLDHIITALDSRGYPHDSFLEDLGTEISLSLHAASKDELPMLLDYTDTPAGQNMLAFLLGIPTKELDEFLVDLAQGTKEITPPHSFLVKPSELPETTDPGTEVDSEEEL